jgi:hypothetical protein
MWSTNFVLVCEIVLEPELVVAAALELLLAVVAPEALELDDELDPHPAAVSASARTTASVAAGRVLVVLGRLIVRVLINAADRQLERDVIACAQRTYLHSARSRTVLMLKAACRCSASPAETPWSASTGASASSENSSGIRAPSFPIAHRSGYGSSP